MARNVAHSMLTCDLPNRSLGASGVFLGSYRLGEDVNPIQLSPDEKIDPSPRAEITLGP